MGEDCKRKWIPEELVNENGIMTQETAINLGYIKIVDFNRTMNSLNHNMAVMDHATAEIKP